MIKFYSFSRKEEHNKMNVGGCHSTEKPSSCVFFHIFPALKVFF